MHLGQRGTRRSKRNEQTAPENGRASGARNTTQKCKTRKQFNCIQKKLKQTRKTQQEKGENQIFVYSSHKHQPNDISGPRNTLPRANEHSKNMQKQQQENKTTLVFHKTKQPQQKKTRGKKGKNDNNKPERFFNTA